MKTPIEQHRQPRLPHRTPINPPISGDCLHSEVEAPRPIMEFPEHRSSRPRAEAPPAIPARRPQPAPPTSLAATRGRSGPRRAYAYRSRPRRTIISAHQISPPPSANAPLAAASKNANPAPAAAPKRKPSSGAGPPSGGDNQRQRPAISPFPRSTAPGCRRRPGPPTTPRASGFSGRQKACVRHFAGPDRQPFLECCRKSGRTSAR